MAETETIGFIGLGVMGRSMARNLIRAGYTLRVFTRTAAAAEPVTDAGAAWCDSPAEVASAATAIITMVGYPSDVEEVYFGRRGVFAAARPGSILIDMTTSSPDLARRIAAEAESRGMSALDAPVSGGDVGAREARLSIMCGGEPDVFARARPILETMGTNIQLQGPPGSGQYTKMVNQIVVAGGMVGISEALIYAERAGLDPSHVLESIASGAAASWALSNLAPRMIAGNFAPGFYVKHFIKDLSIALESADALGLDLPGLSLARDLYTALAAAGHENDGSQALLLHYRER